MFCLFLQRAQGLAIFFSPFPSHAMFWEYLGPTDSFVTQTILISTVYIYIYIILDGKPGEETVTQGVRLKGLQPGALAQGIALSIAMALGCQFETRCRRVFKGHTVCGVAGQECGF